MTTFILLMRPADLFAWQGTVQIGVKREVTTDLESGADKDDFMVRNSDCTIPLPVLTLT